MSRSDLCCCRYLLTPWGGRTLGAALLSCFKLDGRLRFARRRNHLSELAGRRPSSPHGFRRLARGQTGAGGPAREAAGAVVVSPATERSLPTAKTAPPPLPPPELTHVATARTDCRQSCRWLFHNAQAGELIDRLRPAPLAPWRPALLVQPRMVCAPPDRLQGRVRRFDTSAMSAAARVGIGMSAVEELDQNDVESRALGLRARQPANPLDQIRLLLKKASPAGSLGRFRPEPIRE
jgi:hypothetical protein